MSSPLTATIQARTRFTREEPDGSHCSACGDGIFLNQWALMVDCWIDSRTARDLQKTSIKGATLCDACKQALAAKQKD